MCGIVGYVGKREAMPILIEGLRRLEYRGYDSCGVAYNVNGTLNVTKTRGRISVLEQKMLSKQTGTRMGIAHTRWATHGAPNDVNAHPHCDSNGKVSLVHNGIIENYQSLRTWLENQGATFKSQTDTEVLAQLVGHFYDGNLEEAVREALQQVKGTFGICAISADEPDVIIAARKGSPLIVGVGDDEYVIASDASAILSHTSQVIYLADNEMARISPTGFDMTTLDAMPVTKEIQEIEWSLDQIELAGYEHYMLKEIFEQPEALRTCLRGRVDLRENTIHLGGIADVAREFTRSRRIIMTACGTALHAALVAEYLFEDMARIPVEVEYASEFRYRNPVVDEGTVVIAISQSGETADTLAALIEAKNRGALAVGVVNVVGSTIARETDAGVYLHVGPEIGVASTKAFTGQVAVLSLMAAYLGRRKHMSPSAAQVLFEAMDRIPDQIGEALKTNEQTKQIAEQYAEHKDWLYLGRGYNYPVALEGALKLKEISYIHAEGLPAAEMKHGPIALISEGMPVVVIATKGSHYEKTMSNIEEVRSRGGKIIAVATEGDTDIRNVSEHVLYVPDTVEPLQPLLTVVPLQLIAYHAAVARGCNVDKPRNLAKSVTVE